MSKTGTYPAMPYFKKIGNLKRSINVHPLKVPEHYFEYLQCNCLEGNRDKNVDDELSVRKFFYFILNMVLRLLYLYFKVVYCLVYQTNKMVL